MELLERKKDVLVHHAGPKMDFDFLHRFSSLSKLLRITAHCRRFWHNCSCKSRKLQKKIGPITCQERKYALENWILRVQAQEFHGELHSLQQGTHVSEKSKLASLNPFMDPTGLLRVRGRLRNTNLPFSRKHQILLPKNHYFTDLVIKHEHILQLHAGPQLMLACLQRRYWIIGARDRVRYIGKRCTICAKQRAQVMSQMMGDLPAVRVNPGKPFLRLGVDFAGPVMLKGFNPKSRKPFKGYIVIFVCFTTRAIHIELARSLSTAAFIAVLQRFISRGKVLDIYSDCGTTFVGTEKELRFLNGEEHLRSVASFLTEAEINFHFSPPSASHFGGLWEAGIKSIKYHLRRIMGNTVFNYEEMETVLCQIEACLNSRPISALSSDPNDLAPLTPGHFLVGDALTAMPERDYSKMNKITRWQLVQKTQQEFWRRWSSEFLTRLQQRPKWWKSKANVKVGALVIIKDERFPPRQWKMGRVTEVHTGADNLVRVVTLRTANGIIKRPVTKLCLLPNDNDSD